MHIRVGYELCYERDSLEVRMRRRFEQSDAYFTVLSVEWSEGLRKVFRELPDLASLEH
jgi:putative proteasome-type protease